MDKAYRLSSEKKYQEANAAFGEVIKRNPRFQLPYYNRGINFMDQKKYHEALTDFNKIISLHPSGPVQLTLSPEAPFASEETRMQVPVFDAIFLRAQVKYHLDSLRSAYIDFQRLIDNNYKKGNCLAWQGAIWIRHGDYVKGCDCLEKAKLWAGDDEDRADAESLIKTYCTNKQN